MTQEVVKVTGAVDFFAHSPFVIVWKDTTLPRPVGMHVAPASYLPEGISNCFKTLEAASLFLFAIVWHHLEHERLSNFSNFCKTKACWPYFGIASKAIPYF